MIRGDTNPGGEKVIQMANDMKSGNFDWTKYESGPIRVMVQGNSIVTYDNKRLMAALLAGVSRIPIEVVFPNDILPGTKKTFEQAFRDRFTDLRNENNGGVVPFGGIKNLPKIIFK